MALLLFSPSLYISSSSSSSSLSMAVTANPMSSLQKKLLNFKPKSYNGVRIFTPNGVQERGGVFVVRASSDIDGVDSSSAEPPSPPPAEEEVKEEAVSVEKLPLESKLQMMAEQKLKMKLAKKIRLRRKRLVRKRQLRKKGRWPPSKMKKNKNV